MPNKEHRIVIQPYELMSMVRQNLTPINQYYALGATIKYNFGVLDLARRPRRRKMFLKF